jgi:hypothetical protein
MDAASARVSAPALLAATWAAVRVPLVAEAGRTGVLQGSFVAAREGAWRIDVELDGGAGVDTAIIHTNRTQATITRNADGSIMVTSADGTDKISNVEYLKFDDQLVHVAPKTDFNGDGKSDILLQDGGNGDC